MVEYATHNGKEYKVRYAHQRVVDEETGLFNPKGGATVAYISDSREDNPQPPLVSALAECSEHDTYDKSRGRVISLGRLRKKLAKMQTQKQNNVRTLFSGLGKSR